MRITARDKLEFYQAIPVYPDEAGRKELKETTGLSSGKINTMIFNIMDTAPICESDDGSLSYLNFKQKSSFVFRLWQRFYDDLVRRGEA